MLHRNEHEVLHLSQNTTRYSCNVYMHLYVDSDGPAYQNPHNIPTQSADMVTNGVISGLGGLRGQQTSYDKNLPTHVEEVVGSR